MTMMNSMPVVHTVSSTRFQQRRQLIDPRRERNHDRGEGGDGGRFGRAHEAGIDPADRDRRTGAAIFHNPAARSSRSASGIDGLSGSRCGCR